MVSKSWGRAISGPVLAIVGLILLICQLTITDSKTASGVLKYLSWGTLGIAALMVFVAQYETWKAEYVLPPPFQIGHPKCHFWNETERRGSTGVGYYFEVGNSSATESLESLGAQLIALDPPAIGTPAGTLPVPLHIRHKLYATNETEISVPLNGVAAFDIATRVTAKTCFKDFGLDVWVEDNLLRCEPRQTYIME